MIKVPFCGLALQEEGLRGAIESAIAGVLARRPELAGAEVAELEEMLARFCGVAEAVAVNSGVSALHLALRGAGIGPGDEVITAAFAPVDAASAIHLVGATPVYIDINPRTLTLDPERLGAALGPRTKAVVPVHLFGQAADIEPIKQFASEHGLTLIEDASQALGTLYKGWPVGSFGDFATLSFALGGDLCGRGDGGAVLTSDPVAARTLRMLRDLGAASPNHHALHGFRYRMDDLQATILKVKFGCLDRWNAARRASAARYHSLLLDTPVIRPFEPGYSRHSYQIYTIRTRRRELLRQRLSTLGVQTAVHYPIPVHLQVAYANARCRRGTLPHTEAAAMEILSLPMFPALTADQQTLVRDAILHSSCVPV